MSPITRRALAVASCSALLACARPSAPEPTAAAGLGGAWQLESMTSAGGAVSTPDDPAKYTVDLQPDGRALVRADCNHGSGSYTVEGALLRIGPLALTRAYCAPPSLSDRFVAALGAASTYARDGSALVITLQAGGGTLRFNPLKEGGRR